jgi:hypothetical protein
MLGTALGPKGLTKGFPKHTGSIMPRSIYSEERRGEPSKECFESRDFPAYPQSKWFLQQSHRAVQAVAGFLWASYSDQALNL